MRLVTAELKAKTSMVHCRTEIAGARLDLSPGAEDYAVRGASPIPCAAYSRYCCDFLVEVQELSHYRFWC
jgi:hypothetical protein